MVVIPISPVPFYSTELCSVGDIPYFVKGTESISNVEVKNKVTLIKAFPQH